MENILEDRDRVGVPDAILLEDFRSETAFIANLAKRYNEDIIYTYIGQVLVSVNPYKGLGIYSDEHLERHRNVNFYEVPPHVYAIAETAYRSMTSENRDHCILISGESGAGKTEASKHVLRFVAAATLHRHEVDRVRDRLLQSNPVLEAFGNAKTTRNDNSSRFGKYMDIECNYKGDPLGGHIINYLLEKSRVIHQECGERNFHIFYQLLAGASEETLETLCLDRDPHNYHYLSQGKSSYVDSIDDKEDFEIVSQALDTIDFTHDEQSELWKVMAAILHLGNISYSSDEKGHAVVDNPQFVLHASQLLGCDPNDLTEALIHRTIEARNDIVTSPLNLDQAVYARDALSKAIYERLFNWLVSRLNKSLQSQEKGHRKNLMGILDIYGFEIFDNNGFEQFCINYCNEKLQQVFIELTLRSEQEEYQREGILWEQVDYLDNKVICNLIEEKHKGIISILDEECLRPGDATDFTFLEKMDNNLANHRHYFSYQTMNNNNKVKKTIRRDEFRVRHYAGEVAYSVKGFLDKNNDLLYRDLKVAMLKSSSKIITSIFNKEELVSQKRPHTAATQFKNSLSRLMVILMNKEPSYIRCIKPNDYKKPGAFDIERISHQVKYLGLMENLRVRRAGFAYRRTYESFLKRYKCLCPKTWPKYEGLPKNGVQLLMDYLDVPEEEYRMGITKLFIRLPKTLFKIEDSFHQRKEELASLIQATYKSVLQRRNYIQMQQATTRISKNWRRVLAQRELSRRRWAAINIRRFIRGFITRHGEVNEDNARFQLLVKIHWLNRLSKSLPTKLSSYNWPSCPGSCEDASVLLKIIHRLYLARLFSKSLDAKRKILFEEKVLAEQLFKGKKANYETTFPEWFRNSRLNVDEEQIVKGSFEQELKTQGEKTKYSTSCTKYDRHGYKPRDRILVLTSSALHLLEKKEKNLRKIHRFPLKEIQGLFVSKNADGLLMVKIPPENATKDKGDLILNIPNVIEAVTKIISITDSPEVLTILDSESMNHTMKDGKQGTILLNEGNVNSFNKNKDGKLVVVGETRS